MSNQTVEDLWRSLANDGLAGLFETGSGPGVLAALLSAFGQGGGQGSSTNSISKEASVAGLIGDRIIPEFLDAFPLAGGLLRTLLGGESTPATTPAVRYNLPGSIRLDTSLGTIPAADGEGSWGGQMDGAGRPLSPTVVINVNAMDSRSILDRSDDIASAVRQAMLTYQPFDDVWR